MADRLIDRSLDSWPGKNQREPSRSRDGYLVLKPLAALIKTCADRYLNEDAKDRILLDIGCGIKPYYPFFASRVNHYVGIDVGGLPGVDAVAQAERLSFCDQSVDVVLATQILEHVDTPSQVISEISRVLKPGGIALISTHGVFVYHPTPVDYWRWTQTGFYKLLSEAGKFTNITIYPNGGTSSCFGYVLSHYVSLFLARKVLLSWLTPVFLSGLSIVSEILDRCLPTLSDGTHPNTLIANYLAVCEK